MENFRVVEGTKVRFAAAIEGRRMDEKARIIIGGA